MRVEEEERERREAQELEEAEQARAAEEAAEQRKLRQREKKAMQKERQLLRKMCSDICAPQCRHHNPRDSAVFVCAPGVRGCINSGRAQCSFLCSKPGKPGLFSVTRGIPGSTCMNRARHLACMLSDLGS